MCTGDCKVRRTTHTSANRYTVGPKDRKGTLRPLRLAFNTGIPRVGFSHTVPEPAHTITRHGYTRTRTVNLTVSNETRSINGTRGFFSLKYAMYIFIYM